MTLTDLWNVAYGAAAGVGGISVFLLVLLIGFCLALDFTKFRSRSRSKTVKSLEETVGPPLEYLPPDAPRGPVDQLAGSSRSAS